MTTAWTKERLKTVAGISATGKKREEFSADETGIDVSKSKRQVNRRAIPKVMFSGILIAPVLGFFYLFVAGNLNLNKKVEVKAAEPDPEVEEMREQLEAVSAQLEEAEAQLAVVRQEQSKHEQPEGEEEDREPETPPPTSEPEVTPKTVPVAQPPPPRRVVRSSTTTRTTPVKSVPPPPPPPVVASVFGAGAVGVEQSPTEKITEASYREQNYSQNSLPPRASNFSGQVPRIDPSLEAPLLQEQRMMTLRTGTSAKATLSTPWVQALGTSERPGSSVVSVVLNQPLKAAGGKVFLPVGTTILVRAESLGQPDLIEFVAQSAHLPSGGRKIALSEGAIRLTAAEGRPLVAMPLPDSNSQGGGLFDVLDAAGQAWSIGSRIDLDRGGELVEDLLRSQREVRYLLQERERYNQPNRSQLFFLPVGTELRLYVKQEVTVSDGSY